MKKKDEQGLELIPTKEYLLKKIKARPFLLLTNKKRNWCSYRSS